MGLRAMRLWCQRMAGRLLNTGRSMNLAVAAMQQVGQGAQTEEPHVYYRKYLPPDAL